MPKSPRGTVFFNRRSGSFTPQKLALMESRALEAGLEVEEIREHDDLAERVRSKIRDGQTLILVAGGDGTLHYAAQAVIETEASLGILPLGTFNHLAKDLGIPLDLARALDAAIDGDLREIDAGKVNGRFFLNNLIIGIYPDIVREREKLRHWYGKWRAYLRAGFLAFRRFRHVSLSLESAHHLETITTHVFAIAVNEYDLTRAGILAKKSGFDRGRLTVYWLPHVNKLKFVRVIARYLTGRLRPGEEFRFMSTSGITIRTRHRKLRVGVDGEHAGFDTPLHVTVIPRALRVRVPRG